MSAVNPYTPPRAEVADVHTSSGGYQEVKLWSAAGRVGRLRYLAYISIGYLAMFVVGLVGGLIAGFAGSPGAVTVLIGLAAIPYVIFSILMLIQRTHDMGWSGWAALLTLIPFVAFVWVFKAGTPGDNRFGAPPPPNTLVVKIFGLIFPVIAFIGIMAAIALPAYQQYKMRAKAMQQQVQLEPLQK
jgi:uncharacterized membrane protein YhaH (DUF805 family)